MLPLGVQAESELTVYGHVRNVIESLSYESDKESTVDMGSLGSRIGFKANTDLGNGMTGLAQIELGVATDNTATGTNTRLGFVGLAGGFGKVTVGQQGGAFNSSVDEDNSIWEGGIGGGIGNRTSNTIKYANAVGPLNFQLDLRSNDKGDGAAGNGGAIGLKAALSDNITLGFAADMDEDTKGVENDRIGVSGMVNLGQFWGSLSWIGKETTEMGKTTETDYTAFWAGVNLSDSTAVHFGYGQKDDGGKATPTSTTFGAIHRLGGGLSVWYEGQINDDDDDTSFATNAKGEEIREAVHRIALEYVF